MKAMILFDLLMSKKYLVQQVVLGAVVAVFISVAMENLYVTIPILCSMIPFSLAFTLLAFDERNGWQQFRLALPFTRKNTVIGRYASLAIIVLVSLVVGLVVFGLIVAAAYLLPGIPRLSGLLVDLSWEAVVLLCAVSLAIIATMLALVMPFIIRFGMTKAVRVASIFFLLVFLGVFALAGSSSGAQFSADLYLWIQQPEGMLAAAGIIVAAIALLYVLSAAVSVRLYEKREF